MNSNLLWKWPVFASSHLFVCARWSRDRSVYCPYHVYIQLELSAICDYLHKYINWQRNMNACLLDINEGSY